MNNEYFNAPVITGKTNSTIAKISKLMDKKYRKEEKLFVCDGIKLFSEAVDYGAKIKYIVLDNVIKFDKNILDKITKCQNSGTTIICVEKHIFDKLTTESAPQGIITVCEYMEGKHTFYNDLKVADFGDECIMIFDSMRDPGNMGTIMRSAVAFGVDRIILSSDCVDIYSPKVIRSSMGAIFKLKINIFENLTEIVSKLKKDGRRVLATALEKKSMKLGKFEISRRDVFVFGNEGHGISKDFINDCTNTVFIPMRENTESLNVAEAATIVMWELSK